MNNTLGGRGSKTRAEKASAPAHDTPEKWSSRVKKFALSNEADLVGIARMKKEWLFEGYDTAAPWIVVLGIKMYHEDLAKGRCPYLC